MKKFFICSYIVAYTFGLKAQTCNALFSYGAQFEKVTFVNQSSVLNAHYFWNFGDGTGTNLLAPNHDFPENGSYLVTLYATDTINNCSGYYEQWINVAKYSTDPCSPLIDDSVYNASGNYFIKIKDYSANCNTNGRLYSAVRSNNSSSPVIYLGNVFPQGNYISRVLCQSQTGSRAAFKTSPHNYNKSKNYNNCSANFEFKAVSEDTNGQRILFSAMNKNASSYEWIFIGFGTPIYSYTDTVSIYFQGNVNLQFPNIPWYVTLKTVSSTNCKDSVQQSIHLRKQSSTYVDLVKQSVREIPLMIIPNPANSFIKLDYEGNTVEIKKISITDALGQIVYTLNKPKPLQEIDVSFLTAGVYYVKAESVTGFKNLKIIKQ